MRTGAIFILSVLGITAGLLSAWYFGIQTPAQPPVFAPVSNPYQTGIYANGIIESQQDSGSNITVFPEVAGVVTRILVHEGQSVAAGTPLLTIDDSVQRAATRQLLLQAQGARALLDELHAEPRAETLSIAQAQVQQAVANLKTVQDQLAKRQASFDLDPKSISKDILDTAVDAVTQAETAQAVANRQLELTRAGAWSYDIINQTRQEAALRQAWQSSNALLAKFVVRARVAGVVLSINSTAGSYVSAQGAYDSYTESFDPLVVMSTPQDYLVVRCFVDEILVSHLPAADHIQAQMTLRGTKDKVPLEFVRVQPLVSPKIELSNQRQERVDLRVLPVLFRFPAKSLTAVYPGQLVDVFIGPK